MSANDPLADAGQPGEGPRCSECGGSGVLQEAHDGGTHPVHCPCTYRPAPVVPDEDGKALPAGLCRICQQPVVGGHWHIWHRPAPVVPDSADEAREALLRECDRADEDMRKWTRVPVKYLRTVLAAVGQGVTAEQALNWLVAVGVCQGAEESADLHARYCAQIADALADRPPTRGVFAAMAERQRRADQTPCPECGGDRLRPDFTGSGRCHAPRTTHPSTQEPTTTEGESWLT